MTTELWVALAVVAVGVLYFWFNKTYGEKRTILKNGRILVRPARIPFLGIAPQLGPGKIINVLDQLVKNYGPILEVYIGPKRLIIFAESEAAKEMLLARPKYFRRSKIFDFGIQAQGGLDRALFFSRGHIWSQARRFTAPSFNKQNVSAHATAIWNEANRWTKQMVETLADGKTVIEFKQESFHYTLNVITKAGFGIDSSDQSSYFNQDIFRQDINTFFNFFVQTITFPLPKFLWKYSPQYRHEIAAKEGNVRFNAACLEQIQAKRKELQQGSSSTPTLLETLLRKEEGDMLDDKDVLENVKVFYLAGSETTSISIAYAMYFMTFHAEVFQRVRDEGDKFYYAMESGNIKLDMDEITRLLPYTESVLKETIRLGSPATLLTHTLEDGVDQYTFQNGITMRQGEDVTAYLDGVLTNPEYYDNPSLFSPDRWLDPNEEKRQRCEANLMAFGYGPRVCPGLRLAMVEGTLALSALVHHMDFKLGCDHNEVKRIMMFTSMPDKVPMIMSKRCYNK